jgi:phage gpG-like protein
MTPGELTKFLTDFVEHFDFTRKGREESLAHDVVDLVVARIMDRSSRGEAPDGSTWAANSTTPTKWHPQGYRQYKLDKYGWDDPNYRTGQMLSQTSLSGKIVIKQKEMEIGYGTDQPPSRGGSPTGVLLPEDLKVTDTQKAEWAHNGGRPFMGLGADDPEKIVELIQENLNDYILSSPYGHIV